MQTLFHNEGHNFLRVEIRQLDGYSLLDTWFKAWRDETDSDKTDDSCHFRHIVENPIANW